jgi:hypothetical protein
LANKGCGIQPRKALKELAGNVWSMMVMSWLKLSIQKRQQGRKPGIWEFNSPIQSDAAIGRSEEMKGCSTRAVLLAHEISWL